MSAQPTPRKIKLVQEMTPEERKRDDLKRVQKYLKGYVPESDALPGMSARVRPVRKRDLMGLLPDEDDKKNIEEFIKTYNVAYPYPHPESIQIAYEEGIKGTIRDPKKLRKGTKRTPELAMHLPMPFVVGLKKAYPVIFIDKGQFDWFLKNFPNFSLRI